MNFHITHIEKKKKLKWEWPNKGGEKKYTYWRRYVEMNNMTYFMIEPLFTIYIPEPINTLMHFVYYLNQTLERSWDECNDRFLPTMERKKIIFIFILPKWCVVRYRQPKLFQFSFRIKKTVFLYKNVENYAFDACSHMFDFYLCVTEQ